MTGTHPDELTLLAHVEGELDDLGVVAHLQACPACAEQVRLLESGRDVLRSAPQLELPPERKARILARLPERREPRRPFVSLRRALLVAAPVAAVAAVVLVFLAVGNIGGQDGELEGAGGQEAAQTAAEGAAEAEDEGGGATQPLARTAVREVRGPAREVARLLRRAGLDARVVDGAVEVTSAAPAEVASRHTADEIERALANRAAGAVAVYVTSP